MRSREKPPHRTVAIRVPVRISELRAGRTGSMREYLSLLEKAGIAIGTSFRPRTNVQTTEDIGSAFKSYLSLDVVGADEVEVCVKVPATAGVGVDVRIVRMYGESLFDTIAFYTVTVGTSDARTARTGGDGIQIHARAAGGAGTSVGTTLAAGIV